ncbi:MAG: DUF58 domain-containing protein [Methanobacteriota archaeon]|nr:MAG: DUF58 domain-containing protein [Euryarchaeota archaeon]
METSPLGKMLLVFCAVFVLAAYLFMSLSWVVVCSGLVLIFVYSRRRFLSEVFHSQVKVSREVLDELAFAREPVAVKVEIANLNATPLQARFEDRLPHGCAVASGSNVAFAKVPPRSVWSFAYSFVAERRGRLAMDDVVIEQSDVFGLHTHRLEAPAKTTVAVHTRRESLSTAREVARREHFEYAGVTRTPAVALREFEHSGIREYAPGDKARDIHWKAFTRLGRLMTKTYKREGTLETMVLVDCSRSMRLSSHKVAKLDHATDLAIQLSRVLLSNFHKTGAAAFDETSVISMVESSLAKHQFERILIALRDIPGAVKVDDGAAVLEPGTSSPLLRTQSPTAVGKGDRGAFLDALKGITAHRNAGMQDIGLEGVIRDVITSRRGGEMLFVVISDLISSRDAVVSAASLCRRTGNRILVIQTYDDWYSKPSSCLDVAGAERLCCSMSGAVNTEATLRRAGASFIRIGPADTTARIVRSIRRGVA